MTGEIKRRDGLATEQSLQEALDTAVRALAVSSGELGERVRDAGTLLGRLARQDFRHSSDRQLLDRIRHALMRADLAENFPDQSSGFEVTDEALMAIAHDMIELRDLARERALREAGVGR